MPKRISAEEAARRGLVPVEPASPRKITAEEAAARGMIAVPGGGDASGSGYGAEPLGGSKGPVDEFKEWLRGKVERGELGTPGAMLLNDFGGKAKAAAMGFTSNLASRPEELLKTITEPGQNPGWRTEHPEVRRQYLEAVDEHPIFNVAGAMLQPTPFKGAGLARAAGRVGAAAVVGKFSAENARGGGLETQDTGNASEYFAPMAVQTGAEALPPGARALAPWFRSQAGERAVQAVGARAGITDRLRKKGIAPDDVPELGNRFLDEGLVPSGLNPFKNPLEQTKAAAEALRTRSGEEVGGILKGADDFADARLAEVTEAFAAAQHAPPGFPGQLARDRASAALKLPSARFDYERAAEEAGRPLAGVTAAAEDASGRAGGFVEQIRRQGAITPGSFQGANRLKSDAYRSVNWADEAPIAPELHRASVSGLKRSIEDQVGKQLGPEVRSRLIAANERFGVAADAEDLAERALSRDVQKQQFSPLRAAISGAAGMGVGGAVSGGFGGAGVGAALAPYLTSAITSRGPNLAAHAHRIASKLADETGKLQSVGSPAASAAAASALSRYLGEEPKDKDDLAKKAFLADYDFF